MHEGARILEGEIALSFFNFWSARGAWYFQYGMHNWKNQYTVEVGTGYSKQPRIFNEITSVSILSITPTKTLIKHCNFVVNVKLMVIHPDHPQDSPRHLDFGLTALHPVYFQYLPYSSFNPFKIVMCLQTYYEFDKRLLRYLNNQPNCNHIRNLHPTLTLPLNLNATLNMASKQKPFCLFKSK